MSFVYPTFLFALFALAVPIIVHLFNFRKYKTVYFTNVRFLKDIKQETDSRSKLKHLLILISRLLALTALIFAFAQPYFKNDNTTAVVGQKAVSVYIDNSYSMQLLSKEGNLLNEAVVKANEIAELYRPDDKFQLLTNEFRPEQQRTISRDEFIEQLKEIKPTFYTRSTNEVISRMNDLLAQNEGLNHQAYLISDFQKSTTNWENVNTDSTVSYNALQIQAPVTGNLFIDSVWMQSPVRLHKANEKLQMRIVNTSDKNLENIPATLYINGKSKTVASFSIAADETKTVELNYTNSDMGNYSCKVQINDYPVTFDDHFNFNYSINKDVNIYHIYEEENIYINALLGQDSAFNYKATPSAQIDFQEFSKATLIVITALKEVPTGLQQELQTFVDNGGTILVNLPEKEIQLESYNSLFAGLNAPKIQNIDTSKTKVAALDDQHHLFKGVFEKKPENIDLPYITKNYPLLTGSKKSVQNIISLQNGYPLLTANNYGKGTVYVLSSPLTDKSGNLTSHAIFIPTVYNIALYSKKTYPLFYTVGKDELIPLQNEHQTENIYHLVKDELDVIPELKSNGKSFFLQTNNQITKEGFYSITLNGNSINTIAFNYNRKESLLSCYTLEELEDITTKSGIKVNFFDTENKSVEKILAEQNAGTKLWKYFLILALLFLATEIALIKLWKA